MDQRLITSMQILLGARLQMKGIEETRTSTRELVDPCVKLALRGFLGQLSHAQLVELQARMVHIDSLLELVRDRLKKCETYFNAVADAAAELSVLQNLNHQQGVAVADQQLEKDYNELGMIADEIQRIEQLVLADSKAVEDLL